MSWRRVWLGPGTSTFSFSLANPPRPTKPLGCGQILYGEVKSNNHGDIMGWSVKFYYVVILYEKVKPNNHGDIMGWIVKFYYVVIVKPNGHCQSTSRNALRSPSCFHDGFAPRIPLGMSISKWRQRGRVLFLSLFPKRRQKRWQMLEKMSSNQRYLQRQRQRRRISSIPLKAENLKGEDQENCSVALFFVTFPAYLYREQSLSQPSPECSFNIQTSQYEINTERKSKRRTRVIWLEMLSVTTRNIN